MMQINLTRSSLDSKSFFCPPPPPQKIWALISLDQSGASGAKKKWLKKNIVEVGLGPPESSQSIFGIKIFPAPLWSKLIKTQIFWGEEGSKKKSASILRRPSPNELCHFWGLISPSPAGPTA